jgi:lipopolysaccharide/colanic/teichoic acid biosynthesis glycosyltransferase
MKQRHDLLARSNNTQQTIMSWVAGGVLMVAAAGGAAWGVPDETILKQAWLLLTGSVIVYALCIFFIQRMHLADVYGQSLVVIMAVVTIGFSLLALLLLSTRSYYSRTFLIVAFITATSWLIVTRLLERRRVVPVYGVDPQSVSSDVLDSPAVEWVSLDDPVSALDKTAYIDGVVVNLDSDDPDWQRFFTACTQISLPLLHAADMHEHLTGRVFLERLVEGRLSDFQPHPVYQPIKRLFDILIVVAVLPLAVAIGGLAAVAIKLDSPGPVFFIQPRVGHRSQHFRMIKFRSMEAKSADREVRFTHNDDPRVTRVGRLIRPLRIDELPQLWNVLMGEMSVIGPRPEQITFVRRFERIIPFYGYRHSVKPGITGWAQVTRGYAASVASTRDKLEYDLYYAKHCSVWLDIVILMRTIRTIATASGAR